MRFAQRVIRTDAATHVALRCSTIVTALRGSVSALLPVVSRPSRGPALPRSLPVAASLTLHRPEPVARGSLGPDPRPFPCPSVRPPLERRRPLETSDTRPYDNPSNQGGPRSSPRRVRARRCWQRSRELSARALLRVRCACATLSGKETREGGSERRRGEPVRVATGRARQVDRARLGQLASSMTFLGSFPPGGGPAEGP